MTLGKLALIAGAAFVAWKVITTPRMSEAQIDAAVKQLCEEQGGTWISPKCLMADGTVIG